MMGFCGEGEITKITTTKIGNVIIAVRDTQVAFNTASGHKMGERDYIWYLVSRTPQEGSHDGYISILILMFILINKYQLHIDFIKLLIK